MTVPQDHERYAKPDPKYASLGEGLEESPSLGAGFLLGLVALWSPAVEVALRYLVTWSDLPPRMVVHWDADWRPNGWTTPTGSLEMSMIVMGALSVVLTVAAVAVRSQKPRSSWPILVTFYVIATGMAWVNNWIVSTNLR